MSKRPEFTIAQITERFEVSRSTVRRGLTDGRFPDAKKDHTGRWLVPVDNVLQAGFTSRKTWLNDLNHEPGSPGVHDHQEPRHKSPEDNEHAGSDEQAQLKNELAHERAQVDKLKALLEAERNHVESLRMALRMIEPAKTAQRETRTPAEPSPGQPAPALHSAPRKTRLIQRLFNRR